VATAAEHHADLRAREEDLTPRGVVRAVLEALDWRGRPEPRRVLDVCAGYGVWSSEARRLWPSAHVTAVELDERKRAHLERWADEVLAGHDWTAALGGEYDLALGNPHFSGLVTQDPAASMPARLLGCASLVLLFHQSANFQRGQSGACVWAEYPPAAVFQVPGSVRFRTGANPETGRAYGSDSRCYQATLWARGHRGPAELHQLSWLPPAARRWTVQPGTEEHA
jgi:hypothetical protein